MSSWTAGYVADLDYTYGFYRELTPEFIRFGNHAKGMSALGKGDGLTYCELGCGQGFSTNLHAAANPHITFHANDFNPAQIAGARALAAEAGLKNVHFYDAAFANFAAEPGLPESFDIIALHGIYSWISPENRRHIVDFLRTRLKVGGLVYISFNTLPGWAAAMPLRRLLVDRAETSAGPIAPRIEEAIAFVARLKDAGAGYFSGNPTLGARFDKMKDMSRNYLAHEYFYRDWTPFYFADVARELSEAKLTFVGSSHILDHVDAINLSEEQQTLLAETADPVRREGLRDVLINQQFRRDLFAKGPVTGSMRVLQETWLESRFALSTHRPDVPMKVIGARGEAELQADIYEPILNELAKGPRTFRQVVADGKLDALGWPRLVQAFGVLVGAGHVQPCLPAKDDGKRASFTRAFNAAVCKRAEDGAYLHFLASPVTGGGIQVDRFGQLFLAAAKNPNPVNYVWSILSGQGQRLVKDGKPLETAEENLAYLQTSYAEFQEKRLPILKQLGIA